MEAYYLRIFVGWYLFTLMLYIPVFSVTADSLINTPDNLTSPSGVSSRNGGSNKPPTGVTNITVTNNKTDNVMNTNLSGDQKEGTYENLTTQTNHSEDSQRPQNNKTDNIHKAILEGGGIIPLSDINSESDHVKTSNIKLITTSTEEVKPTKILNVHLETIKDDMQSQQHQTLGRKGVVFNIASAISTEWKHNGNDTCICCAYNTTETDVTKYNCTLCCGRSNSSEVQQKKNSTIANVEIKTLIPTNLETTTKFIRETRISSTDATYIKGDVYQASPPLKKKNKPTFTLDEAPTNLPIQLLPSSVLSPESNYIIPVVAVILAAPLVIVFSLFLYKRGKEFWERRHYRRMDFLIDGMYND